MELKRLRTYQSDVEELMQRKEVSKASIALAENERRVETEKEAEVKEVPSSEAPVEAVPSTPPKVFSITGGLPDARESTLHLNLKRILITSGVVLLMGGLAGGVFYFVHSIPNVPVLTPPKIESPKSGGIALQGKEGRANVLKLMQSAVASLSVPQNQFVTIPMTIGDTPLTTAELLAKLESSAPATLVRALGPVPTLGVHGFQGGKPFLLFGVSSYDFAFEGMLAWEEKLILDIGPVFSITPRTVLQNVGSTTAEALQNTVVYKDIIIKNKDARAAFDPQGAIVLVYGFLDKDTLVVTTDEETFRALLGKAGGGRLR